MKVSRKQAERFKWAANYISKEVRGGRHIIVSLGSAGLTFNNDIDIFRNWCLENNHKKLAAKILAIYS